MSNTIPPIASACAIHTLQAEMPSDKVIVKFAAGAPATPTVMYLEFSVLGGPLVAQSVQVPPHATPQDLVDIAVKIPLPAHVKAYRAAANGPDAGSILFMTEGTAFTGFRLHIQVPDEYQQVDPANISRRASYWGDAHPSQFV